MECWLERLRFAIVGESGMGALSYHPTQNIYEEIAEDIQERVTRRLGQYLRHQRII